MFRRWICILLTALLLASLAFAEEPAWSAEWDELVELKGEEARYLARRDVLWSLVDADGEVIEADMLSFLMPVPLSMDGPMVAMIPDGRWGCLLDTGEWLVEPAYDYPFTVDGGVARVCLNGKWGYLLDTGEYLVEPRFDEVGAFTGGLARVCLDGKWGYLLDTGEYLVEPRFDAAGAFFGGFAEVRLDGKWGYIDEQGVLRIEPRFDDCGYFYNGSAEVEVDGLRGLIDEDGAYLIEPKYYGINSFEGDYATVARQGAYVEDNGSSSDYYEYIWGVVDRSGTLVLPMEYDSIEIFPEDSVAVATLGDETHYFHLSGSTAEEVAQLGSSFTLEDYYPNEGSKVAVLDEAADVQWYADAELPRLDGATALFPVYSAIVQATYPGDVRYGEGAPLVTCTKTNRAYERLIEGSADVIFCAGPSDEQLASAEAAGVELELTPFGAEAFVFTVNADNPLENITTEQIQGVYSGAITDWSELGVDGLGEIVAYQRPKNSGSQTALEKLMGDVELMTPPQQLVTDGMMDILENIEYRNLPNAIGYSFRFYCTEMVGSGVKLLSIDGMEPTLENIRSGAYPHVTTLYAVTRKGETNPNVQILLSWLTSEQGQKLVEASGYVGNAD